jgi:2-dehydro-3-deoxyphosphogluconate aldolase/(4S)-4-hydroxy-2-oxoglutarate aldolase
MSSLIDLFLSATKKCPLVPVLTIDDAKKAGEIARALHAAGLSIVEVTLRTEDALAAIEEMKKAIPDLLVGAGTILSEPDIRRSLNAGSDFLVTPATTKSLRKDLSDVSVPVFPGIATPSEALEAYDAGFEYQKFFPAESNGGVKALQSIAAPMPGIKFMPTGGIGAQSAPDYLSCSNVIAVGGSWMVSKTAIKNSDWQELEARATQEIHKLKPKS